MREIASVEKGFGSQIAHNFLSLPERIPTACSTLVSHALVLRVKLLLQRIQFEGVSWMPETGFPE
jgi:hypothetical protein